MTHLLSLPILAVLVGAALLLVCTATPSLMSYEDYLSLVVQQQRRQQQQELQRDKRRSERDYCTLFPFNRTVTNEDGCVGYLPLFGCAGRCRSMQIPYYYTSRYPSSLYIAII